MKTPQRFLAAFAATTTIHAALVGALMQSEPLKPTSARAQKIAMIDIVEPEPVAAKPAPAPPPKPPEKKPEPKPEPKPKPKPKPVQKTVPKPVPKPAPLSEPKPEPQKEMPKEEISQPVTEPEEPKIEEETSEPSAPSASTHRYEVSESYLGRLRARIQACLRYPMMARRLGLEGETLIRFMIRADGSTSGVMMERSSGHRSLDERAVATVQEAAPFEAPPEGKELSILLPVSFTLERSGA